MVWIEHIWLIFINNQRGWAQILKLIFPPSPTFGNGKLKIEHWFTLLLQILGEERFRCIEKIKTIGYTYMGASGLTPETNYSDMSHVVAMAEFAFSIRDLLQNVNQHSFNNFKMRVGKGHTGPHHEYSWTLWIFISIFTSWIFMKNYVLLWILSQTWNQGHSWITWH